MPPLPNSLTAVEILVLAAIADRPRYGYELVQRIEDLSGGRLSVRPGNLYRVLHRLAGRGLVDEASAPPDDDGDRRQYFIVTPAGRRMAADQLDMYAHILAVSPELSKAFGDA